MTRPLIDTDCSVETPEGINFNSTIAGTVPRALAYVIDFSWRLLIYILLAIVSAFIGNVGWGFFLIFSFLLEWFYPVYFEVFRNGQTPGKKSMGIKVVNDDFTPVRWNTSIIRNLLRSADFFPVLYLFGIISITCSKKFQRLGDMAAGTLVIYSAAERKQEIASDVKPVLPAAPLTLDERQAIADFTDRTDVISEPRQIELTDILTPLTNSTGKSGLMKVLGIGAWIRGKKDKG